MVQLPPPVPAAIRPPSSSRCWMKREKRNRTRGDGAGNKLPFGHGGISQFVCRTRPFVDTILLSSSKMRGVRLLSPARSLSLSRAELRESGSPADERESSRAFLFLLFVLARPRLVFIFGHAALGFCLYPRADRDFSLPARGVGAHDCR